MTDAYDEFKERAEQAGAMASAILVRVLSNQGTILTALAELIVHVRAPAPDTLGQIENQLAENKALLLKMKAWQKEAQQ